MPAEPACAPQTAMEWAQLRFLRELVEALLKAYQQTLFVTHTAHELLWGYKDEILSLINVFKPEISPYFGLYYGVSRCFFPVVWGEGHRAPMRLRLGSVPKKTWPPRGRAAVVKNQPVFHF